MRVLKMDGPFGGQTVGFLVKRMIKPDVIAHRCREAKKMGYKYQSWPEYLHPDGWQAAGYDGPADSVRMGWKTVKLAQLALAEYINRMAEFGLSTDEYNYSIVRIAITERSCDESF